MRLVPLVDGQGQGQGVDYTYSIDSEKPAEWEVDGYIWEVRGQAQTWWAGEGEADRLLSPPPIHGPLERRELPLDNRALKNHESSQSCSRISSSVGPRGHALRCVHSILPSTHSKWAIPVKSTSVPYDKPHKRALGKVTQRVGAPPTLWSSF